MMDGADVLKCLAGIGLLAIFVSLIRDMGVPDFSPRVKPWKITRRSSNYGGTETHYFAGDLDAVTDWDNVIECKEV